MLVKFTTSVYFTNILQAGVNFTNILRAPFSYESLLSSFSVDKLRFDFFWRKDTGAKAARKTLVKLTTGFLCKSVFEAFMYLQFVFVFFGKTEIGKKNADS